MLDQLPVELLASILKENLTIDELLTCRCVSKKFRFVIENLIRYRSFCVYEWYLPVNKIWFSTDDEFVLRRAGLRQVMRMSWHFQDQAPARRAAQEQRLCFLLSTTIFSRLRWLYMNTSFCLSHRLVPALNQLTCLERLRMSLVIGKQSDIEKQSVIGKQLDLVKSDLVKSDIVQSSLVQSNLVQSNLVHSDSGHSDLVQPDLMLSLPNLRILDCWISSNQLTLNCPQLERLRIRYADTLDHLKIVHPESIVHLECPQLHPAIRQLVNLEALYCQFIKEDAIDDDLLVSLPKLRELHFDSKDTFVKLAEQRKRVGKIDQLSLYLLGVRLDRLPTYELRSMSHILWADRTRLLFSNYPNIAHHLPFVRQLHYEPLLDQTVPPDFAGRLVNLNHFQVCRTQNLLPLIELLSRLRNIIHLTFQFTEFGQNIFNSIPFHCPRVLCLRINDEATNHNLNFEFLFRFEFLHEFVTNHNFDRNRFDLILRLFKRLKFFRSFHGMSAGRPFEIDASPDTGQYELKNGLNTHYFATLDELRGFLFSRSPANCSTM